LKNERRVNMMTTGWYEGEPLLESPHGV